ncbi:hypothetical protein GPECTOR_132g608 [Gonium pectorale]|uniref:ATP-dependent DNA ligase family profile domain-containing protein n=1 Tax=Gonium pectorale TaxID=33097 RepID=A0A150FYB2_GONPE|nr:hypothetical protein GPECTOR_132g608 [Gonium pectorale]|eukprot:KXZ42596.1 hypothetical protein GPECTOR_132g608 [Gonium pectorale]
MGGGSALETSAAAAATAAGTATPVAPSWEEAQRALLLPPSRYDPLRHACWAGGRPAPAPSYSSTPTTTPAAAGGPTPYAHVAACLAALESTTKRLAKEDALTNAFRAVLAGAADPRVDLVAVLYLLTGRIGPEYERLELNVGGATVGAALGAATGASGARLKQLYRELGDLGDVAQACRRTQSTLVAPAPLLAGRLLAQLRALAADKGTGVAARRQAAVLGLLRACREGEVKYLTRTLISNLRVGANWRSVLGPLGRAVLIHRRTQAAAAAAASSAAAAVGSSASVSAAPPPLPSKAELDAAASAVVAAYHLCPCFELLVPALLEDGPEGLERRCVLTPGVPLKPMLARICGGVADGLRQLGPGAPFLAEYKYDGVRAQIHLLPGGQVRIFSRNCEDRTEAFPDVCALVRAAAGLGATGGADGPEAAAGARAGDGDPRVGPSAREPPSATPRRHHQQQPTAATATVSLVLDAEVVAVEWVAAEAALAMAAAAAKAAAAAEAGVPAEEGGEGDGEGGDGEGPDGGRGAGGGGCVAPPYRLRAFQELATRSRGQVAEHEVTVQVCVFVFDLLPLRERRSLLPAALPRMSPGRVMTATAVEVQPTEPPQLQQQPGQQQAGGAAPAGRRGGRKGPPAAEAQGGAGAGASGSDEEEEGEEAAGGAIKRDYCEGLRDSVDVVPIGAWYGQGRKVKWFSPFLLAVYDPVSETFQSLCRCMSGFSDEFYTAARERLGAQIIPGPKPYYDTGERPSVWFEPTEVWELRGADLTLSPVHRAAAGRLHPGRGVGLRFPR